MTVVNEFNDIKIEKFKEETCCKKIYPNGNVREIKKRSLTKYRAVGPSGRVLYENSDYKPVKSFALNICGVIV